MGDALVAAAVQSIADEELQRTLTLDARAPA